MQSSAFSPARTNVACGLRVRILHYYDVYETSCDLLLLESEDGYEYEYENSALRLAHKHESGGKVILKPVTIDDEDSSICSESSWWHLGFVLCLHYVLILLSGQAT